MVIGVGRGMEGALGSVVGSDNSRWAWLSKPAPFEISPPLRCANVPDHSSWLSDG